jgi:hypothetical protein
MFGFGLGLKLVESLRMIESELRHSALTEQVEQILWKECVDERDDLQGIEN